MTAVASAGRVARLAGLPVASLGYAGLGALRRWRGEDPDAVAADLRRRSADRTRRVLGQAKGGALKAGQLLSTVDSLFPADPEDTWRRALATLPADNPAVPLLDLEPVLVGDLGGRWRERFTTFDDVAAAAASIGQVHAAVWPDGRRVAVKIQYPGVAYALRTDLRLVSIVTRLGALIAPKMSLPPLVTEMRARLTEELDYQREGRVQQTFADAFADDPSVVIPSVLLATPRVLVSEWLDGVPFTALAPTNPGLSPLSAEATQRRQTNGDLALPHPLGLSPLSAEATQRRQAAAKATVGKGTDQATRDAAGAAYMRFLLAGPEVAGWLHTDPHPGNFRWTGGPDGKLGVLDFGSALAMPDGMPRTFGRLISLLREDDPADTLKGLQEEGFVREGSPVDPVKLRDYLSPFSEPSQHDVFTFSPEWLRGQFGRLGDPRNPDFAVALQLTMPPEHLFTHRVWLGIVGVLCQLEATIEVRPVVRRWLPGLD